MQTRNVGIDAGGSLIKVVIEENHQFHYKKYPISELSETISWLSMMAQEAEVYLTGGKAEYIREHYFPNAKVVQEFEASSLGAAFLMKQSKKEIKEGRYLLVNIGTGTSWSVIDGNHNERVLGSGIGGGTLMGLSKLMMNKTNYQEIVSLAEKGKKANVDLLVGDIYLSNLTPIDADLTASNFAKAATMDTYTEHDLSASIINMMAETIVLLSKQTAAIYQLKNVVFIGSSLINNSALRTGLDEFSKMVGLTATFLPEGEFSGAIGSILSGSKEL